MSQFGFGFGFNHRGATQGQGVHPPAGYAFVTTQNGSQKVTTNNGANRIAVKVS